MFDIGSVTFVEDLMEIWRNRSENKLLHIYECREDRRKECPIFLMEESRNSMTFWN